jgi:hypothetical protein
LRVCKLRGQSRHPELAQPAITRIDHDEAIVVERRRQETPEAIGEPLAGSKRPAATVHAGDVHTWDNRSRALSTPRSSRTRLSGSVLRVRPCSHVNRHDGAVGGHCVNMVDGVDRVVVVGDPEDRNVRPAGRRLESSRQPDGWSPPCTCCTKALRRGPAAAR